MSKLFEASMMMSLYFDLKSGLLCSVYCHERRGNTPPSSTIFFTSSITSGVAISSSTMRSIRASGREIFEPPENVRWIVSSSTA